MLFFEMKLTKNQQLQRRLQRCHHRIHVFVELLSCFLLLLSLLEVINCIQNAEPFTVAYQIHEAQEPNKPTEHRMKMHLGYRQKRGVFRDAIQKAIITKHLIVDQYHDSKDSLNRIYNLINDQFSDPAPRKPSKADTVQLADNFNVSFQLINEPATTTTTATTTTEYQLTRYEFGRILGRNFRGLQRLTDIEWQDALNQSKHNLKEYQQEVNRQFANNILEDKSSGKKLIKKA